MSDTASDIIKDLLADVAGSIRLSTFDEAERYYAKDAWRDDDRVAADLAEDIRNIFKVLRDYERAAT